MIDTSDFEKAFPEDVKILNDILERANPTQKELEQLANALVDLVVFYGYKQKIGYLNV